MIEEVMDYGNSMAQAFKDIVFALPEVPTRMYNFFTNSNAVTLSRLQDYMACPEFFKERNLKSYAIGTVAGAGFMASLWYLGPVSLLLGAVPVAEIGLDMFKEKPDNVTLVDFVNGRKEPTK